MATTRKLGNNLGSNGTKNMNSFYVMAGTSYTRGGSFYVKVKFGGVPNGAWE